MGNCCDSASPSTDASSASQDASRRRDAQLSSRPRRSTSGCDPRAEQQEERLNSRFITEADHDFMLRAVTRELADRAPLLRPAVVHMARSLARSGRPMTRLKLLEAITTDIRSVRSVRTPGGPAPDVGASTSMMIRDAIARVSDECTASRPTDTVVMSSVAAAMAASPEVMQEALSASALRMRAATLIQQAVRQHVHAIVLRFLSEASAEILEARIAAIASLNDDEEEEITELQRSRRIALQGGSGGGGDGGDEAGGGASAGADHNHHLRHHRHGSLPPTADQHGLSADFVYLDQRHMFFSAQANLWFCPRRRLFYDEESNMYCRPGQENWFEKSDGEEEHDEVADNGEDNDGDNHNHNGAAADEEFPRIAPSLSPPLSPGVSMMRGSLSNNNSQQQDNVVAIDVNNAVLEVPHREQNEQQRGGVGPDMPVPSAPNPEDFNISSSSSSSSASTTAANNNNNNSSGGGVEENENGTTNNFSNSNHNFYVGGDEWRWHPLIGLFWNDDHRLWMVVMGESGERWFGDPNEGVWRSA